MPYAKTYQQIEELIGRTLLNTLVAREIVRRSGIRPGSGTVIPGGATDDILLKASDNDYDVEWDYDFSATRFNTFSGMNIVDTHYHHAPVPDDVESVSPSEYSVILTGATSYDPMPWPAYPVYHRVDFSQVTRIGVHYYVGAMAGYYDNSTEFTEFRTYGSLDGGTTWESINEPRYTGEVPNMASLYLSSTSGEDMRFMFDIREEMRRDDVRVKFAVTTGSTSHKIGLDRTVLYVA